MSKRKTRFCYDAKRQSPVAAVAAAFEMEGTLKITVKWSGKEYEIEIDENSTVANFKSMIHKETGVRPDRQKLLNLKLKGSFRLTRPKPHAFHPPVFSSPLIKENPQMTNAGWGT